MVPELCYESSRVAHRRGSHFGFDSFRYNSGGVWCCAPHAPLRSATHAHGGRGSRRGLGPRARASFLFPFSPFSGFFPLFILSVPLHFLLVSRCSFLSPSRLLVSCYFLCIDSCRWILVSLIPVCCSSFFSCLILDTWSLFVDSFPLA